MKNFARIGSVVLCVVMLLMAISATGLSVAAMTDVSLMPPSADKINQQSQTGKELAGSFTFENGVLKASSTGKDGYRLQYEVNQTVSTEEAVSWFASVKSTVRFNVALVIEDVNGESAWMGLAGDFFNRFTETSTADAIDAGEYKVELDFTDACSFNAKIPEGEVTIKEVQIAIKATDGAFEMSDFHLGDRVKLSPILGEEEDDSEDVSEDVSEESSTVTTKAAVTTASKTTAGAASGGLPTAAIIGIVVGAVLVIGIVVVIVLMRKKSGGSSEG